MNIVREPVLIVNLVKAALTLVVAFGLVLTADQQNAVVAFVTSALALVAIIGIGAKVERDHVTPVAAPRLSEDTVVEVTKKTDPTKVIAEKVL